MTNAIANTASITLITGLPGSGKSLRMVQFCKEAHERGDVVFTSNFAGLKLPHINFDDPRKWREIPAGSILVVDEAQQWFRTRRGGEAPEYLTAMETIRHEGVRLVVATQQPDYLDAHLRGLVGLHEHLVRVNGKPAAKIYRHHELMDNVRSEKARTRYDNEDWLYPPELFPLYESAQVHTVKRVYSSRFKRGLMLGAVMLLLMGGVAYKLSEKFAPALADEAATPASGGGDAAGSPASLPASENIDAHSPEAIAEYAARFVPRVPEIPLSAPAYDDREVVADPIVVCAIAGPGEDADGEWQSGSSCRCLTEQGTLYAMPGKDGDSPDQRCRYMARWGGNYNPFKAPQQAAPVEPGAGQRPAVEGAQATAVVPVGAGDRLTQQAAYGAHRGEGGTTAP